MKCKVVNDYCYLREQLQEILEAWGDDIRNDDVESFYYLFKERLKYLESFKLYRYNRADLHSIRNFEKQTIHLSENGNFNDVYEGLPSSQLQDLTSKDLILLNDAARITCFSETNDNLLMWSHYADSHKGFCVEYDLKLLNRKDDVLKHIFPIVYQKQRTIKADIQSIIEQIAELDQAIIQDSDYNTDYLNCLLPMFVTKGVYWEYEKEWRVIYTKLEKYQKYMNISNIPFECITGIYLGHRIDSLIKEIILESAERLSKKVDHNISVYESRLSNTEYKLNFIKI